MTSRNASRIEHYVSSMLQATKRLLSLLTGWSMGEVEEERIFDEYNQLQSYFLQTIQLFENHSMDELLSLPDELYNCLKSTLAQGPEAIEGHLPLIKAAILKLLSAIKAEQSQGFNIYLAARDRVKKVRIDRAMSQEGLWRLFESWQGSLKGELYLLDSERNVQYQLESMDDIQPYSVVSIRESLSDPRLHAIRETIEQALSQALAKDPVQTPVQTSQSGTDPPRQEERDQELSRLRARQASYEQETARLKDQLARTEQRAIEAEQARWKEAMQHVGRRLEALQDEVDQLKTDITERRCRPSKDRLGVCESEAGRLGDQLQSLRRTLESDRPRWKKQWETELQQIVREQHGLKAQETLIGDLSEDHRAIQDVLDKAGEISRLHQRKKENGGEYTRPAPELGFDGMASVLKQVSMIKVDHAQRLEALEKAHQARAKTLSQHIDAFERELVDFVCLKKLKNTGGPEHIEHQRQMADKTLIQHMFANPL